MKIKIIGLSLLSFAAGAFATYYFCPRQCENEQGKSMVVRSLKSPNGQATMVTNFDQNDLSPYTKGITWEDAENLIKNYQLTDAVYLDTMLVTSPNEQGIQKSICGWSIDKEDLLYLLSFDSAETNTGTSAAGIRVFLGSNLNANGVLFNTLVTVPVDANGNNLRKLPEFREIDREAFDFSMPCPNACNGFLPNSLGYDCSNSQICD